MRTLFDPQARAAIMARVQRFEPHATRRWGGLSAPQVLAHLADQLRISLGDLVPRPPRGPFRRWPVNKLVIHWIPWPAGRARGPSESFSTPPADWERDRAALLALIDRFGHEDPDRPWPQHPLFGRITGRDHGVLSYRHLDHHLRQFSC
jgi:hypothetical protein